MSEKKDLFDAIEKKDITALKKINKDLYNEIEETKLTFKFGREPSILVYPIQHALKNNFIEGVKHLLEHSKCDKIISYTIVLHPYCLAYFHESPYECLRILINKNYDMPKKIYNYLMSLDKVYDKALFEILEIMQERTIEQNTKNRNNYDDFISACNTNNSDKVKKILENNTFKDMDKIYIKAVKKNNINVVKVLSNYIFFKKLYSPVEMFDIINKSYYYANKNNNEEAILHINDLFKTIKEVDKNFKYVGSKELCSYKSNKTIKESHRNTLLQLLKNIVNIKLDLADILKIALEIGYIKDDSINGFNIFIKYINNNEYNNYETSIILEKCLFSACIYKNKELFHIVKEKYDTLCPNIIKYTTVYEKAFIYACKCKIVNGDEEISKILLDKMNHHHHAYMKNYILDGLNNACKNNNLDLVIIIIDVIANNVDIKKELTTKHAYKYNNYQIVNYLINNGATDLVQQNVTYDELFTLYIMNTNLKSTYLQNTFPKIIVTLKEKELLIKNELQKYNVIKELINIILFYM